MKTKLVIMLLTLASSFSVAQPGPPPPGADLPQKQVFIQKRELGAWWKNGKVAEKLNLTDSQIKQLEDTFYQHRMKLIDYTAEMQKADLALKQNLDGDNLNESQVNSLVDAVLAARGKVEREFTTMQLDFRKILSNEQWKQLRAIRGEDRDHFIIRRAPGPGHQDGPPPGTGPGSELLPENFSPDGADCTSSTGNNGMKIVHCYKKIEITNDTEHEL